MDFREKEWNESYKRKDNFVFYPHEEVIRFVSKFIRKRVGVGEYSEIENKRRGLDLGCGIGRHVLYLSEMGLDPYGIDLSSEAIDLGKRWMTQIGKENLIDKMTVGSITAMPYENDFFDFVISHGVLDSMNFDTAQKAVIETQRVMRKGGLFYFDVVSGCDYEHYREYEGEEIVETEHEKGTVQSYFNWSKINRLLQERFMVKEAFLVQRESVLHKAKNSRYHVIVEKI